MKIIYLTDIHDHLKNLRFVIQNTDADLYIISGDLIYKAFYTEDKLYEFLDLQDQFYRFIARDELSFMPYEFATRVLSEPEKHSNELVSKSAQYRFLFQQAAVNMKEKYQVIKSLVEKYAKAETVLLPGNYDMDLQYTALYQYDLHRKSLCYKNIRLAGYGGAPIVTPGIPEMLSVVFDEYNQEGKTISEPRDFFTKTKPDILVTHNPAYGTLDRIRSLGHCGSFGIRDFIDDYQPPLVLSGHVHEDFGLMKVNKTYCLNPANFGGVDSIYGYEEGGYFCSFILEKNGDDTRAYLRQLKLLRLVEENTSQESYKEIREIVNIKIDKNFRSSEDVIDEVEFAKVGRFLR